MVATAAASSAVDAMASCRQVRIGRNWLRRKKPGMRAHTEAHTGGRLLAEHLAANDLAALQAMMPPGLTFDPTPVFGSPSECLGWWWS